VKTYIVKPATRQDVNHLVQKHYLHRWPGVTVCIVGLLDSELGGWIGTIVFALPPRETAKRYKVGVAWELARLFVEDGTPKNTETWFMSRAITFLHHAHPEVELLISYADPSVGHTGTIYRAGNWISDGRTDQERKTPRFDYVVQGKKYSRRSHVPEGEAIQRVSRISKYRFVYWMKEHEKRRRECAGIMRRI
jgi:hypothetical protein